MPATTLQKEIAGVPYDQGLLLPTMIHQSHCQTHPSHEKKPFLLSIILDG